MLTAHPPVPGLSLCPFYKENQPCAVIQPRNSRGSTWKHVFGRQIPSFFHVALSPDISPIGPCGLGRRRPQRNRRVGEGDLWPHNVSFLTKTSHSECVQKKPHQILLLTAFPFFLLRYNSHTIQFTGLKCTVQWFLVYSQGCAIATTNSRTFPLSNF